MNETFYNATANVTATIANVTATIAAEAVKTKPGFEAVFAIAGLLAIAYLVLRQRD